MSDISTLAAEALKRLGVTPGGDISIQSPVDGSEIGRVRWNTPDDVRAAADADATVGIRLMQ